MKKRIKGSNSEPSQRQLRVGEQLRHVMSETLQRGHFTDALLLDKSNTLIISEVRMSPDLKHAKAYVTSINGEGMADLLPALNAQARIFQKEIAKSLNLKFTPRIRFAADNSFDEAQHIEKILRDVNILDND